MRLGILLLALLAAPAQAAITNDCGKIESPLPYNFCITKTTGSKNTDVLYYLHGGGGSEKQWIESAGDVRAEWEKSKVAAPIVITVSFGPMWILVPRNSLQTSGLLDLFQRNVMPELERRALGRAAERRLLAGASMGGFNGVQLVMNLPGAFARAAITCAAIVDISPWASPAEIKMKAKQLGVPDEALENVSEIARYYVPDEITWRTKVSPLELAPKKIGPRSTAMLVAGNTDDKLYFEGSQLFAAAAQNAGAQVWWQAWPGDHCYWNAKAIADFLIAR